jgi:hypothetical protein
MASPSTTGDPDALIESSGDLARVAREMAAAAHESAAVRAAPATFECIEAALGAIATAIAAIGVGGLADRALHPPAGPSDEALLDASHRIGDLHRRLLSAQRACRPARQSLAPGAAEPQRRASSQGSVTWLGHHRAHR